jgi:hypothetical protein
MQKSNDIQIYELSWKLNFRELTLPSYLYLEKIKKSLIVDLLIFFFQNRTAEIFHLSAPQFYNSSSTKKVFPRFFVLWCVLTNRTLFGENLISAKSAKHSLIHPLSDMFTILIFFPKNWHSGKISALPPLNWTFWECIAVVVRIHLLQKWNAQTSLRKAKFHTEKEVKKFNTFRLPFLISQQKRQFDQIFFKTDVVRSFSEQ